MKLRQWTHRYRYELKTTRFVERVGYSHTGIVQVYGERTPREVEALAKRLHHGTIDDAQLADCQLIEYRGIEQ
jgi:hypothetical protein